MTDRIRRSLRPGSEAAREARRAVEDLAPNLPPAVMEDVRLLVSELVTNSVRHANVGRDGAIELSVSVAGATVRVEVVDPGPGFERKDFVPSIYQMSGWGLYFVGEIADRWGVFRDGGTHVWFEMDVATETRIASSLG